MDPVARPDRVGELLQDAARGRFPPADGRVEVVPAPPGPAMAVVGFPGHFVVAADVPQDWVRERLVEGDLHAPLGARFVSELAQRLGRRDDGVDMLLAAPGLTGRAGMREVDGDAHPRVLRACEHRDEVRAYSSRDGAATMPRLPRCVT